MDYSIEAVGCEIHALDLNHDFVAKDGRRMTEFKCTLCSHEVYDWQLENGKHPKLKRSQYEFVGKAVGVAKELNL